MLLLVVYYKCMQEKSTDINKKVGDIIRIERAKKNFSQEALAHAANISVNGMGKIERGDVSASIQTLEKIAKALEISIVKLVDFR